MPACFFVCIRRNEFYILPKIFYNLDINRDTENAQVNHYDVHISGSVKIDDKMLNDLLNTKEIYAELGRQAIELAQKGYNYFNSGYFVTNSNIDAAKTVDAYEQKLASGEKVGSQEIYEALNCRQVLGQTLTPEEVKQLQDAKNSICNELSQKAYDSYMKGNMKAKREAINELAKIDPEAAAEADKRIQKLWDAEYERQQTVKRLAAEKERESRDEAGGRQANELIGSLVREGKISSWGFNLFETVKNTVENLVKEPDDFMLNYAMAVNSSDKVLDSGYAEFIDMRCKNLKDIQEAVIRANIYQPGGPGNYNTGTSSDTWCNQSTFDVAESTGVHMADAYEGRPTRYETSANAAAVNLAVAAKNPESPITAVSPKEAQFLADNGITVIVAWENTKAPHGHLSTVAGSIGAYDPLKGPRIANVGSVNGWKYTNEGFRDAWANKEVKFYYDRKQETQSNSEFEENKTRYTIRTNPKKNRDINKKYGKEEAKNGSKKKK